VNKRKKGSISCCMLFLVNAAVTCSIRLRSSILINANISLCCPGVIFNAAKIAFPFTEALTALSILSIVKLICLSRASELTKSGVNSPEEDGAGCSGRAFAADDAGCSGRAAVRCVGGAAFAADSPGCSGRETAGVASGREAAFVVDDAGCS
jgi:hypothetical protein